MGSVPPSQDRNPRMHVAGRQVGVRSIGVPEDLFRSLLLPFDLHGENSLATQIKLRNVHFMPV